MPNTDKSSGRPKRSNDRSTYKHQPNGLCVTIYSPNGAPVPKDVQESAARAIQTIAQKNGLLIGLANA